MLELGRKREETFRLVGEGTNKELDLDPFDVYYNHLIIWDSNENELVGSYRIGKGDEIIERFGMEGFYLSTLFTLNKKLTLTLRKSIELGRSFIAEPYQRKPTTLLLLWKGIHLFMEQNPTYNFLIGPVSISNNYSKNSKKSIISFSEMYLHENSIKKFIKPKNKFKSNSFSYEKVDKLVQRTHGDIDKLDQLIQESDNGKKLPILLKKYIGLNAKIVAFNVDKKFNNCLDGFLFLEFNKITSELKERIK
jgi:putative hemolysin